jgi:hypothetical protein
VKRKSERKEDKRIRRAVAHEDWEGLKKLQGELKGDEKSKQAQISQIYIQRNPMFTHRVLFRITDNELLP